MLVDIEFLLKEHLENAKAFFEKPTEANFGHAMDEARVVRQFGHEVVAHGIYCVGSPNTANHLREVVADGLRHQDAWCGHRSYGTADSVDEILAYAKPEPLGQACVVFMVPVPEIYEKSGPWLGPVDEHGRPKPAGVVLDWSLVPIDSAKLEAALEKRAAASPAP